MTDIDDIRSRSEQALAVSGVSANTASGGLVFVDLLVGDVQQIGQALLAEAEFDSALVAGARRRTRHVLGTWGVRHCSLRFWWRDRLARDRTEAVAAVSRYGLVGRIGDRLRSPSLTTVTPGKLAR